jgi:hypothetical protein
VACACALVFSLDLSLTLARLQPGGSGAGPNVFASADAAARALQEANTTVLEEATTSTEGPTTTTEPPTTTTTVPPIPARPASWTLGPYQGVGVWIDVYDWTSEMTSGNPRVGVADIDRMADLGIQTVYIQTSHRRSASDVMEPERLLPMIDQAHARGMSVVGWYLPMLEDVDLDLRRLVAAASLPIDGVGVDIESLSVANADERNARLLQLSTALRQSIGEAAMSAIVQSPVVMQVVNPGFWPRFPWVEVGQLYDVIQPMSYWTERKPDWRSGERVSSEDIDRIRASTGRPDMPVHLVGGIANGVSDLDLNGMIAAIQSRNILGGSLYDWSTSQPFQWDLLRILRAG